MLNATAITNTAATPVRINLSRIERSSIEFMRREDLPSSAFVSRN